ncbi:MAG: UPF0235 protein [Candidatus Binatia bacterium]|nr:MAG: UPF0235 protein [Candidatus Binatia bacterium]
MDNRGKIEVRVVPGAPRDEIVGWVDGALKVRVAAPPEKGAANRALERLLSRELGLPAARVRIVAGGSSRRKLVEVEGLAADEIRARIGAVDSRGRKKREFRP